MIKFVFIFFLSVDDLHTHNFYCITLKVITRSINNGLTPIELVFMLVIGLLCLFTAKCSLSRRKCKQVSDAGYF